MSASKTSNSKLHIYLISIALGIVVAVVAYQAQIKGLIPNKLLSTQQTQLQTNTIVKEESAIIAVTEKSSVSVVAIGVSQRVINPFTPYANPRKEDSTIGTGFIVSDKGIIVTNKHVVSDLGVKFTVITKDGKKHEVKKVYKDPVLDLALVQIDPTDLKAIELGDSDKLQVGQTTIAIGNALGRFTNTVTTGVVSGLGRSIQAGNPFFGYFENLDNLIQTDAAINPGNSGGPLLNLSGQVIGVNVAMSEGAQNIGFAIPINAVKPIVDEFIKTGKISKPFLGIRYRFISKDIAILNEVPQGAYIQEVVEDSPAEKAGISEGDIITKMNGQTIDEENKVVNIISKTKIGENLELNIWRDGKEIKLKALMEDSPQF